MKHETNEDECFEEKDTVDGITDLDFEGEQFEIDYVELEATPTRLGSDILPSSEDFRDAFYWSK